MTMSNFSLDSYDLFGYQDIPVYDEREERYVKVSPYMFYLAQKENSLFTKLFSIFL